MFFILILGWTYSWDGPICKTFSLGFNSEPCGRRQMYHFNFTQVRIIKAHVLKVLANRAKTSKRFVSVVQLYGCSGHDCLLPQALKCLPVQLCCVATEGMTATLSWLKRFVCIIQLNGYRGHNCYPSVSGSVSLQIWWLWHQLVLSSGQMNIKSRPIE